MVGKTKRKLGIGAGIVLALLGVAALGQALTQSSTDRIRGGVARPGDLLNACAIGAVEARGAIGPSPRINTDRPVTIIEQGPPVVARCAFLDAPGRRVGVVVEVFCGELEGYCAGVREIERF